ncbi:uncharacterized protein LOC101847570 [Aplysia californica]|uniref:Uncharacterized protein LOC101847570 n=1 Tax=Aplysia californica TaxID=6500 RepID=A0ABM0ZWI3_APLCA|nr:uncharacterized protein LOC101847570 [Aplysia californica]XP_012935963.1 uncharacterized protein LOC101847570 [Aplysia californica]XP_012935964.1 uncharacterized protein LOC101847570 [Aplysia californica]XP_012935965.1 uncharacterized protein LOC101847570 [Aplysia californica]
MVSVGVLPTTPPSGTGGNSNNNSTSLNDFADDRVPIEQTIQLEEILIVLIIVIFWFLAVLAFLRKWDSIRIMQPMEPRYRHSPKNLENIKIVKRPQDSIIYKNYSRKVSVTMVEREKRRLQRMHTVPCMSALPAITRLETLPTIHMEEVTTEM